MKSRHSQSENAEHHEMGTVSYPQISTRNSRRSRKIREARFKVRQRRHSERTIRWRKGKSRRRTAQHNEIADGINITGTAGTTRVKSRPRYRRQLSTVPPETVTDSVSPISAKGTFDDATQSAAAVTLLILITFPPGVLVGYLVVVIIFCIRNKRCLCCTEGCEVVATKLFGLRNPRSFRRRKPGMSLATVSERGESDSALRRGFPDPTSRQVLEEQFEQDRRFFQQFGKDPFYSSNVDDLDSFRNSPTLAKKEWLRNQLKLWIQKDRRRCLSGQFTDPNGPPDTSPRTSTDGNGTGTVKSVASDFTSVSQSHNPRDIAASKPSVKDTIRKLLPVTQKETSEGEDTATSEGSLSSVSTSDRSVDTESSIGASEMAKEDNTKGDDKEVRRKKFETGKQSHSSKDTNVSVDYDANN